MMIVKNKLVLLSLLTAAVMIAAMVFVKLHAPQTEKERLPFFPELASRIEAVNHISIRAYGESINLTRINNVWGIDEFDAYPALPDKVKSTVLGAADLRINAPKTALPRLYHRLGVEGPEVEDTSSLLLTLRDASAGDMASIIVGKPRRSSTAQGNPGLYVRKPDDPQSYLVDGVLEISATKTDWIQRSLFDIPAEAVKSIRIVHSDGDTFKLFKSEAGQAMFELENLPPGKKLASDLIISRFGSLLQDMQISGARAKSVLAAGADQIRARLISFQGLIADITLFELDGIAYASFDFSYVENPAATEEEKTRFEEVKAYTEGLNQAVKGWWFEIPGFKYDIIKQRSELIVRDDDVLPSDPK